MVKMDGTKKTYLSGQDKEGNLQYSDTPTDITLRTQDEKGNFKSLIKGKMSGDQFFVEQAATTLPDGRMGEMTVSNRLIQLDGEGNMDLKSAAVTEARRPAAEAAAAYAKPQDVTLTTTADGRVSADYGKVKVGEKEYTAVASGTMSADGKKANFDKAMLKDGDQFVKGTDGKPIELTLPNIELSVTNNNISPMTGDVKSGSAIIADAVLKEQKSQFDAKEASDSKRAKDAVADVDKGQNNEIQRGTLREIFSKRLEELGITDTGPRAMLSSTIADTYMSEDFRKETPDQARTVISGIAGSDDRVKAEMGDFAARIQEGVAKAMNDKMPTASKATAPVADTAAVAEAAKGATQAGTSAPQEAPKEGTDLGKAATGTTTEPIAKTKTR